MASLVFLFYNKFYNEIDPVNSETSVFFFAINLSCKLMFLILHNLGNYQAIFWHSRNLFCKLLLWIMGLWEFCNNNHCNSFSSNQTFFWTIFFPNIAVFDIFLKLWKLWFWTIFCANFVSRLNLQIVIPGNFFGSCQHSLFTNCHCG